jgi:hypothetical protein
MKIHRHFLSNINVFILTIGIALGPPGVNAAHTHTRTLTEHTCTYCHETLRVSKAEGPCPVPLWKANFDDFTSIFVDVVSISIPLC